MAQNWLIYGPFIYIYAYTGFVGLGPHGRRPTPLEKFKRKNKLLFQYKQLFHKITKQLFHKITKQLFQKITKQLLQKLLDNWFNKQLFSKSTANAPTHTRSKRSSEMAIAFATSGNSICN